MNDDVESRIKKQFEIVIDIKQNGKSDFEKASYTSFYYGYLAACKDNGLITAAEYEAKLVEFATAGVKIIMEKYGL